MYRNQNFVSRPSPIDGLGMFTTCELYLGDRFPIPGYVMDPDSTLENYCFDWFDDQLFLPSAPFLRMNHSEHSNCEVIEENSTLWLYVTETIEEGEEILIDYGYNPAEEESGVRQTNLESSDDA